MRDWPLGASCVVGGQRRLLVIGPAGLSLTLPGMWFEELGSYRGLEALTKMRLSEREVHRNLKTLESVPPTISLFSTAQF